jgi:hypothetical protein
MFTTDFCNPFTCVVPSLTSLQGPWGQRQWYSCSWHLVIVVYELALDIYNYSNLPITRGGYLLLSSLCAEAQMLADYPKAIRLVSNRAKALQSGPTALCTIDCSPGDGITHWFTDGCDPLLYLGAVSQACKRLLERVLPSPSWQTSFKEHPKKNQKYTQSHDY